MVETTSARVSTARDRVTRRAAGVTAAALGAVLVWVIAVPLAGLDLAANQQGAIRQVGLGAVVTVAVGAGLVGWALLALLERLTSRGRRIWMVIASVVLALSLLGPIGGGVGLGTKVVLSLMHLVVGATLVVAFTGGTTAARPRRAT